MNALAWLARGLVLLCWVPFIYGLWFYDAAREAWQKWRLGDRYEGPAED